MKYLDSTIFKIAISATIAIFIGNELGIQYAATAGIIAILSIQNTKKKAFVMGLKRFVAGIIAILLSYFLYKFLGNASLVFGIFLIIFLPLTKLLKISDGVTVGAVLSTHLLVSTNINFNWVINEFIIVSIGIGVALICNLYMPSLKENFDKHRIIIEEKYKVILFNMADALVNQVVDINEQNILDEAEKAIDKSMDIAYRINDNHLFSDELYYIDYMQMRKRQLSTLKRMRTSFSRFYMTYEQTNIMAEFTKNVAKNIYQDNDCVQLIDEIEKLKNNFRQMELPKTRDEFENRALLFQFLNGMEDFLEIKREFKCKYR